MPTSRRPRALPLVFLVMFVAPGAGLVLADSPPETSDLEQRRLALEERRLSEQIRATNLTFGSALVTGIALVGTLLFNVRNAKKQAIIQARLKALDTISGAPGPWTGKQRLNVAAAILGRELLDPELVDQLDISGFGPGHDQNRKDLIEMLISHPDRQAEVLALWKISFGTSGIQKDIASFDAYVSNRLPASSESV